MFAAPRLTSVFNFLPAIQLHGFHTSASLGAGKAWRQKNGLPVNPNSYGPLTDLPDYTFLDGRRTPAGSGKLMRAQMQLELSEKIMQLGSEVDFAVKRRERLDRAAVQERERIIGSKLKTKGSSLQNNSPPDGPGN